MRFGAVPDDIRMETTDSQLWVVHRQGYRYPLLETFHEVDARLRVIDAASMDTAVLSCPPTLFLYWCDARQPWTRPG